jgi:hypothetical protein
VVAVDIYFAVEFVVADKYNSYLFVYLLFVVVVVN